MPSRPVTTWPTPPMEKRTSALQVPAAGNRYDVNGSRSHREELAWPAAAHLDCASAWDSFLRRSMVHRVPLRRLSPSVKLLKRRSSRLIWVLPNSLKEGESL